MTEQRSWWPPEPLDSPEVLAALVAEAEEGFEAPRAEFVGRPQEAPELEALRRIVLRVPFRVRNEAQRRADEKGIALSELVAEALHEHLKRLRREARAGKTLS